MASPGLSEDAQAIREAGIPEHYCARMVEDLKGAGWQFVFGTAILLGTEVYGLSVYVYRQYALCLAIFWVLSSIMGLLLAGWRKPANPLRAGTFDGGWPKHPTPYQASLLLTIVGFRSRRLLVIASIPVAMIGPIILLLEHKLDRIPLAAHCLSSEGLIVVLGISVMTGLSMIGWLYAVEWLYVAWRIRCASRGAAALP